VRGRDGTVRSAIGFRRIMVMLRAAVRWGGLPRMCESPVGAGHWGGGTVPGPTESG